MSDTTICFSHNDFLLDNCTIIPDSINKLLGVSHGNKLVWNIERNNCGEQVITIRKKYIKPYSTEQLDRLNYRELRTLVEHDEIDSDKVSEYLEHRSRSIR